MYMQLQTDQLTVFILPFFNYVDIMLQKILLRVYLVIA